MSFTLAQLRTSLAASSGRQVSDGDAALAFVQIDQDALRVEHAARVRWERWDGGPINGASAEYVRSRLDYGGGEIYLVYVDGVMTYLQPHDPEGTDYGPIQEHELAEVADRHVRTIVEDLVFEAAVSRAVELLPAATVPVMPTVGPTTALSQRVRSPDA